MSSSSGFPQLDISNYPSQVFWLVIAFVTLYLLMSEFALPLVGNVLEKRREKKEGDLDKAESLSKESEKLKATYEASLNKARQSAANTLSSTEQEIHDRTSQSQEKFAAEARERIKDTEDNIAKAKEEALLSLTDISAEIAADIVLKVSGLKVNDNDAKKAVTSVMKKG